MNPRYPGERFDAPLITITISSPSEIIELLGALQHIWAPKQFKSIIFPYQWLFWRYHILFPHSWSRNPYRGNLCSRRPIRFSLRMVTWSSRRSYHWLPLAVTSVFERYRRPRVLHHSWTTRLDHIVGLHNRGDTCIGCSCLDQCNHHFHRVTLWNTLL